MFHKVTTAWFTGIFVFLLFLVMTWSMRYNAYTCFKVPLFTILETKTIKKHKIEVH